MRYLWILFIPIMAFAVERGDREGPILGGDRYDRSEDVDVRDDTRTGARPGSGDLPSGGIARADALSAQVPWRQIEQWIIFDDISNREVFRRLNKSYPLPGGGDASELAEDNKGNPFTYSFQKFGDAFHFGWSRFFSLQYHGPKSVVGIRFRAMPDRKGGHTLSPIKSDQRVSYRETCRAWTARVGRYWARYYRGEQVPQLPCVVEPIAERVSKRETVPGPEPFLPQPDPSIATPQAVAEGPVVDQGVRTSYKASDGRPIQGQNNPGHHRVQGSAALSSGQVIIDLPTSVGAGRNDMSFIDLNYVGHARSTDTANTNTYTVYALSKNKILIKSSSGTDTATVNFTVEGQ